MRFFNLSLPLAKWELKLGHPPFGASRYQAACWTNKGEYIRDGTNKSRLGRDFWRFRKQLPLHSHPLNCVQYPALSAGEVQINHNRGWWHRRWPQWWANCSQWSLSPTTLIPCRLNSITCFNQRGPSRPNRARMGARRAGIWPRLSGRIARPVQSTSIR